MSDTVTNPPESFLNFNNSTPCWQAETVGLPFPEPLSERYRPAKIGEFIGLEKVRKVLGNFAANPYPSAWLFVGGSGLGKTTMAMALADEINGEIQHIPSKNCDLATIERVCERCHYVPMHPKKFWVVIVDEADRMTEGAQLALLSKLDSTATPPNTVFVFTANSTDGLEKRFLSRCRQLEFSSYGLANAAAKLLCEIWDREAANLPKPNFERIVKNSNNNVRDALMNLEIEMMGA